MSIVKKILAWIVAKFKALIFGKPVVADSAVAVVATALAAWAPTAPPLNVAGASAPAVIVTPKS